jgi:hypothetical protein
MRGTGTRKRNRKGRRKNEMEDKRMQRGRSGRKGGVVIEKEAQW